MSKNSLKIIYTSDVHGQLTSSNYATHQKENYGLSRLKSYLDHHEIETLLLDNGDILQGSVLLDYHRLYHFNDMHPVAAMMNHLGYQYITLGNHDFNYGFDYILSFQKQLQAKIICSNIVDQKGNPVFPPYAIHQTKSGLKIGIIGAITSYIPIWEKPKHIKGLTFLKPTPIIEHYLHEIESKVDMVIVLYHGGFEKDILTGKAIGRQTHENEGYMISQIPGIHVLLTGHQHVPQHYQITPIKTILQTGYMAKDFGEVDVEYEKISNNIKINHIIGTIKPMTNPEDAQSLELVSKLEDNTQTWLDEVIGVTQLDMTAKNALDLRNRKHPLMQLINQLQLEYTQADISAASLPNSAMGFSKTIKLRDLAANFVYPNTLIKLEVTGKIIKQALERTAEYYHTLNGELMVDESFLYPKEEHYNLDIYDGIDYVIDVRKQKGNRITSVLYKNKPLQDDQVLTFVLNNYRAVGGGDYMMFREAKIVKEYDITLFNLMSDHIKKNPKIYLEIENNFKLLY